MSGKQTLGGEENEFEDQCKSPGLHTVFMLTILGAFLIFPPSVLS